MAEQSHFQFFVENQSGDTIYGITSPFTIHIREKALSDNYENTAVKYEYVLELIRNVGDQMETRVCLGIFPTYDIAHNWADKMLEAAIQGSVRFSFKTSRQRNWVTA